jgi:hypothetical protein
MSTLIIKGERMKLLFSIIFLAIFIYILVEKIKDIRRMKK